MVELDLAALLVGGGIGAIAGFVAGVYVMFKRVLLPVQALLGEVNKLMNKAGAVLGGGKQGGGGILGTIQGLANLAGSLGGPPAA